jgi:hypothetical protein
LPNWDPARRWWTECVVIAIQSGFKAVHRPVTPRDEALSSEADGSLLLVDHLFVILDLGLFI